MIKYKEYTIIKKYFRYKNGTIYDYYFTIYKNDCFISNYFNITFNQLKTILN